MTEPTPTRGAIRTEISTSTDVLVAGTPFTLFVTVYNPYEVPITLHRISTYLPTEFVDVDKELQPDRDANRLKRFNRFLSDVFGALSVSRTGTGTGTGDGHLVTARGTGTGGGGGSARTPEAAAALVEAQAKVKSLSDSETAQSAEGVAALEQAKAKVEQLMRATYEATYPFTLQPGNSKTCIFTLRTRQKMWFTPSTYKLSLDVIYDIANHPDKNSDTIQKTLQVRASLVAVALGAAAGALVGWIISRIDAGEQFGWEVGAVPRFLQNIFSLLATLLLAMMSVIVIARKKDTQPVVSVEDIWGGVVVGFLVAYSGQNFIGQRSTA